MAPRIHSGKDDPLIMVYKGICTVTDDKLTRSYPTFLSHIFLWFELSDISCTTNYRSCTLCHMLSTIKQYIFLLVFKVSNESVGIFFFASHKQNGYESTASGFQVMIDSIKDSLNFFQYPSPSLTFGASTIDRQFRFSSFYSIVCRL